MLNQHHWFGGPSRIVGRPGGTICCICEVKIGEEFAVNDRRRTAETRKDKFREVTPGAIFRPSRGGWLLFPADEAKVPERERGKPIIVESESPFGQLSEYFQGVFPPDAEVEIVELKDLGPEASKAPT